MKIADKISLSFMIVAVLFIVITMFIFYKMAEDNIKNEIFAHLRTTAHSRAAHIETFLRMYKREIELLAESPLIEDLQEAIINTGPVSARLLEETSLELREYLEAKTDFHEIFVLNPDGKIIVSSNENNIGLDRSGNTYFTEGKNRTYIKGVYHSKTTGEDSMAVSTPILDDETKEFLGVLVIRLNLTALNKISSDRTGLGKTGEIYLVNKHSYMVTPSRFIEGAVLKRKVDTVNVRRCLAHKDKPHLSYEEEIDIFQDYRGINVLGTHEYIPEMEWILLAEIEAKEALAPLDKIKHLFLIMLFSAPIVIGLIATFVSKAVTGPIQKLHKGTEIIGSGNLDYKVGTDAKDEIGQLSRAFDEMTGSLKKTTTSIDNLNKEITGRKKAEEALRDYATQLERSNKELDDFTYIVSHDLREPLRSMDAFSKFMIDDYGNKLSGQGKDYLERIRANAGRMGNLIEGLLEISRIERKKNPFEEVQVQELVNEVKLRLEYAIEERNVEIVVRDKLPKVFCDRVRFTEVFVNLVSNAIKFNDKPSPHIEIGSSQKGNYCEFYVKDNGPGIKEQYFDKIFEIFQRLGKREEHEGTGAGLAITKRIVQMHKGEIRVESKIGKGATFYFTIPKKEGG